MKTKGFITIATGKDEYYELAYNLLRSYRYFCKNPLPFTLLADRENDYAKYFDNVIIFSNGATNSYLDKLELGNYLPYDINIFIDADCLAYGDLNTLFDTFNKANDFSAFGRVLPLDDETGWFEYKNLGELQDKVSYVVGLHGGIYYLKKGDLVQEVCNQAKLLVPNYYKYKFKGKFDTPGDEPLIALSMALNQCHPIPFDLKSICCYWEYLDKMKIDISKGEAFIGDVLNISTNLVHWGTRYTRKLKYQEQVELLNIICGESENKDKLINECKKKYNRLLKKDKIKKFLSRVKNKILRTFGVTK